MCGVLMPMPCHVVACHAMSSSLRGRLRGRGRGRAAWEEVWCDAMRWFERVSTAMRCRAIFWSEIGARRRRMMRCCDDSLLSGRA